MKRILLCLGAFALLSVYAIDVQNIDEESHISGPKLTAVDLQTKVILVEYFGFSCGPCIAAMPKTVEVAKTFKKDKRFVVVLSHVWPFNEERIKGFLDKTGAEDLPTYQKLRLAGEPLPNGVPHARVYNHKGECVWKGHPSNHKDMEEAIKAALKKAPKAGGGSSKNALMFEDLEVTLNKDIFKQLVIGKNIEKHRKALAARAQQPNPKGIEAKVILDEIETWIEIQKGSVDADKEEYPSRALQTLRMLNKMLPTETRDYKELFLRLSKDKKVVFLEGARQKIAQALTKKQSVKQRAASFKMIRQRLSKLDASDPDVQDVLGLLEVDDE